MSGTNDNTYLGVDPNRGRVRHRVGEMQSDIGSAELRRWSFAFLLPSGCCPVAINLSIIPCPGGHITILSSDYDSVVVVVGYCPSSTYQQQQSGAQEMAITI